MTDDDGGSPVQGTRSSAAGALAVALVLLAGCTTQVAGRAVSRSASPGPTSTAPVVPSPSAPVPVPEQTTTVRPSAAEVGLPAVCDVLARSVPPTIDDLDAFVDALDDESAERATSSVRSTVAELEAALGDEPGSPELATAVRELDDALGRIARSIDEDDPDAYNDAIDDLDASYTTAAMLCRYT